jgi:hypothetical protein
MGRTRLDWLTTLSGLSDVVAGLKLSTRLADEPYWDDTLKRPINKDAYNLSGCQDHNVAIARWIDGLAAMGLSDKHLTKVLTDMTSRNTYGSFSELAAYGTLIDHKVPFAVQIPATAKDILNPNGSDLDGRIELSVGLLFDVKAFGLQEHLVGLLNDRLKADFPTNFVAIEGSWDLPLAGITDLLGPDYSLLKAELASGQTRRGTLDFKLRSPSPVQLTVVEQDPYELAEKNAAYAFNYAKQFARRKPFLLIFVLHPWFGGQSLSVNFSGYADVFTRAFARRTFMQFLKDRRNKQFGLTRGATSKLLSGLMFIDAWAGPNPPKRDSVSLFLNPHAKRPISELAVAELCGLIPQLIVDRFSHDVY